SLSVRDVEVTFVVHIELMGPPKSSGKRSKCSPGIKQFAVEVELQNFMYRAIAHPQMLVLVEVEEIRVRNISPLVQKLAVFVEDLDARIFAVANIQAAFGVDNNAVNRVELAWAGTRLPPFEHIFSILRELNDARVLVSVSDIEVAIRHECHVGRLIEMRLVRTGNSFFTKVHYDFLTV